MDIADIVISRNGRDAGKRFFVIAVEDGYSLIADGKGRRAERPKRKKNKHLIFEDKAGGKIGETLAGGGKISNSELRRALAEYIKLRGEDRMHDENKDLQEIKGGVPKCQKTT